MRFRQGSKVFGLKDLGSSFVRFQAWGEKEVL